MLITSGNYKNKTKNNNITSGNDNDANPNSNNSNNSSDSNNLHPKLDSFIIIMRRIASDEVSTNSDNNTNSNDNSDNSGIVSLLSYLDRDEDGLIEVDDLMRLLRREKCIVDNTNSDNSNNSSGSSGNNSSDNFTERDIESILKPILIQNTNTNDSNKFNIVVTGLLYLVEHGSYDPHAPNYNNNNKHKHRNNNNNSESKSDNESKHNESDNNSDSDSDDSNDNKLTLKHISKQYEFSNIPEVYEIEKKMRQIGRLTSQKGVDIEHLFHKFDIYNTGSVRTTEFIEILTSMGLYILERGKAIDMAIDTTNTNTNSTIHNTHNISKQKSQISHLRSNYESNAGVSAQKLISAEERLKGHRGGRSDFRVRLFMYCVCVLGVYCVCIYVYVCVCICPN